MKSIEDILDSYNIDCTIAPHKEGVIVLFLFPYAPFERYPEGHLFLDNYYIVSFDAIKTIRAIIADLAAHGYKAVKYREEFLKPLAVRLGAAKGCKNDLVYTKEYGSYFYIDAIFIEGVRADTKLRTPDPTDEYSDCNLCFAACPNAALSDSGFDRARCIRQFMDRRHNPTDEEKMLIGDRLMGCIECRLVCPRNSHIKAKKIPHEILAATRKDNLDMKKIKELIGGNLFK